MVNVSIIYCTDPSRLFLSADGSTQLAASSEFTADLLIRPRCVLLIRTTNRSLTKSPIG